MTNAQIAERLDQAADLLAQQGASPFRVNAHRRAAQSIRSLGEDVAELFARRGRRGLDEIPGIGSSLAQAIAEMIQTGRWSRLDRLRGEIDPEGLFQTIPGVGPALARAIHDNLHVESLEALEIAAHDGRLGGVPGIGPRRAAAIRALLADMLARLRPAARHRIVEPPVSLILDVDREYRAAAAAGGLRTIAPRRFNPSGAAWLPILHADRGCWHFTALFSNTALAHKLNRTDDWVVIHFQHDSGYEGQRTVVTERTGPLAGRRVVRGRELESPGAAVPATSAG